MGVHLPPVFQHQVEDIDIVSLSPAAPPACEAPFPVFPLLGIGSVQAPMARLLVGVDEDLIPVFLFPDGILDRKSVV